MPNATDFAAFLQSFQSQKFRALRPAQAYVLEQYNNFLTKTDIGVELPTGAGKTLEPVSKMREMTQWKN